MYILRYDATGYDSWSEIWANCSDYWGVPHTLTRGASGEVQKCNFWRVTGAQSTHSDSTFPGNDFNRLDVYQICGQIEASAMVGFYFDIDIRNLWAHSTTPLSDVPMKKRVVFWVTTADGSLNGVTASNYVQGVSRTIFSVGNWNTYSEDYSIPNASQIFYEPIKTAYTLPLTDDNRSTRFDAYADTWLGLRDYASKTELWEAIKTAVNNVIGDNNPNDYKVYLGTLPSTSSMYFADDYYISSNCPIYHISEWQKAQNCLLRGNIEQAENLGDILIEEGEIFTNLATNWICNVTNPPAPQIRISWSSPAIESKLAALPDLASKVKAVVRAYQLDPQGDPDEFDLPYTNKSITQSWSEWGGTVDNSIRFDLQIKIDNYTLVSSPMYVVVPKDGNITQYSSTGADGSTLRITKEGIDPGYNEYEGEISDIGTESELGGTYDSKFSTTYQISPSNLESLASFIWNNDAFNDNIKLLNNSPIENIVSVKLVPTNVPAGSAHNIVCGNIDTGVSANKCQSSIIVDVGSVSIPGYYNNFLDYAPYTTIGIFLPFCGFHELDAVKVEGRTLSVKYIFDLITGMCKACLFADGVYIQSFDGNGAIDIPMTASNNAQIQAGFISSIVHSAVGRNPIGMGLNAIDGAMAQHHYTTEGSYSPSVAWSETRTCYVIVDRPKAQYPGTYAHDFGFPCKLSKKLGSLTGYTVCASSIDLSGIDCISEEREMIKNLLTSGIYL